jgi:hypothetical protein
MRHTIAFYDPKIFAGWPANNGLWVYPDGEVLVGCVTGAYNSQPGHNLLEPYTQRLLRSLDGGETWQVETPRGYAGSGDEPSQLKTPLDFTVPGFALRLEGAGYHGSDEPRGAFYASADRGHSWAGPFALAGLHTNPELEGEAFSPRTDYIFLNNNEALVFLSVRGGKRWKTDRTFCAHTMDGGMSFSFQSWMVPNEDPFRSVMPSTVRLLGGELVSALRRRRTDAEVCWIDVFSSRDEGTSWQFLGKVGDTGAWNGNPPALVGLPDGRLCCAYGDRERRKMITRTSQDGGQTWQNETVLREDFAGDDEPDFGYPRLARLPSGELLAVYYWATDSHPQQHIAATRWRES